MNKLFAASVAALLLSFAGVWYWNASNPASAVFFEPPYNYEIGDALSSFTAFAFSFVFSILFFGYSAPLAMLIEGAKFASLYTRGGLPWFDLLFVVPDLLACYSAILLGANAWEDFKGTGSLFKGWREAFKYFIVAAALLGALLVARGFF